MKDPPSLTERDQADAKRLRELALTRTPGYENPVRERAVIAEIIASYTEFARAVIRGALAAPRIRGRRPTRFPRRRCASWASSSPRSTRSTSPCGA